MLPPDFKSDGPDIQSKARAPKLRLLMDWIDQKMHMGVRLKDIQTHLNKQGFEVTLYDLRKARFKWLKSRKQNQQIHGASPKDRPLHGLPDISHLTTTSDLPSASDQMSMSRVANKGDLARLRSETEIDLNELARLGKKHSKEKSQ